MRSWWVSRASWAVAGRAGMVTLVATQGEGRTDAMPERGDGAARIARQVLGHRGDVLVLPGRRIGQVVTTRPAPRGVFCSPRSLLGRRGGGPDWLPVHCVRCGLWAP
jgi:hypothetical protein